MCLMWGTKVMTDHGTVVEEKLDNKMELNVAAWSERKPLSVILGVVNVVRGNYGTPLLSRTSHGRFIASI